MIGLRYFLSHEPARCTEIGTSLQGDETVEALVQALMVITPEHCGYHATHWMIPLLHNQVRKNPDRQYGEMTMRRCLQRLGWARKRPRHVLAPDPQREKKASCSVLGNLP